MSAHRGIERWHRVIADGSRPAGLAAIVHADAVFHSPVVHTPQRGQALVLGYLAAAGQTLGNASFRYVRELVDGENVMLEFITDMEGITVNGVDIIRFDENGMILDFKVMVRPFKAVNKVWEMMAAQLATSRN